MSEAVFISRGIIDKNAETREAPAGRPDGDLVLCHGLTVEAKGKGVSSKEIPAAFPYDQ